MLLIAVGAGLGFLFYKDRARQEKLLSKTASALVSAPESSTNVVRMPIKVEGEVEPTPLSHAFAPIIVKVYALSADDLDGQAAALEALLSFGPNAFTLIEGAWRDAPSLTAKAVFARALARLGSKESVAALLTHAREEQNPEMRDAILGGLDVLSSSASLRVLAGAYLEDRDPASTSALAAILERSSSADLVSFLGERYPDASATVAPRIREMLANIRDDSASPALENVAMKSPEPNLREAAFFSLAKIASPQSIASLIAILQDPRQPTAPEARERLLAILANVKNPSAAVIVNSIYSGQPMPEDVSAALGAISSGNSLEKPAALQP